MSHEEGESSKGVDQGKEDKRSKSRETKDDGSDQHKHRHHKREKSKQDIRKSKDDSEEKKDHHRREKSREKHHKHEKSKHDGEDEQEKKSSRNSSRKEGLERKESSRRTIKHARHASEMPADNNAVLMVCMMYPRIYPNPIVPFFNSLSGICSQYGTYAQEL